MAETDVEIRTKQLIDRLKATCGQYGLGNDGNEYKIITEVFLYKYMNDMFGHEAKQADKRLANAEKWDEIVIDAALLQVSGLKKTNSKFEQRPKDFENGRAYKKARRAFFKANEKELAAMMHSETQKIVEKMNALLPKK